MSKSSIPRAILHLVPLSGTRVSFKILYNTTLCQHVSPHYLGLCRCNRAIIVTFLLGRQLYFRSDYRLHQCHLGKTGTTSSLGSQIKVDPIPATSAALVFNDLTVSPNQTAPGHQVTIGATAVNSGSSPSFKKVILIIDTAMVDSQDITVPALGKKTVTFNTFMSRVGTLL